MNLRFAIANISDSRSDFLETRKPIIADETESIDWLRNGSEILESGLIRRNEDIEYFTAEVKRFNPQALIVHLPVWGDPLLTTRLATRLNLPTLLLGNTRPDSSSIVGVLGAGGALDQIGYTHLRVFDGHCAEGRQKTLAYLRAAAAFSELQGMTLGLFGGHSLGIVTAGADAAQWQRIFGVYFEYIDQLEIKLLAEKLPIEAVERYNQWLSGRLGAIHFSGSFTPDALNRQIRSYLATRQLVNERGLDFVGVKCQPEMSNGYCTQCLAHLLCNSQLDADGSKPITVHACESDADGALTMQVLNLLSGGLPASLMDLRYYDFETGLWTLANCGAIPPAFAATPEDPDGFAGITAMQHVFGEAGGGAYAVTVTPRKATLARLCRRSGEYWMAILPAEVLPAEPEELMHITPAFPKAIVRTAAGADFLHEFSSNHIHMITGDFTEELMAFCDLVKIPWKRWG